MLVRNPFWTSRIIAVDPAHYRLILTANLRRPLRCIALTAANHVEEGVADLPGSPGHHHLDRGLGSGRVSDCKGQTSV